MAGGGTALGIWWRIRHNGGCKCNGCFTRRTAVGSSSVRLEEDFVPTSRHSSSAIRLDEKRNQDQDQDEEESEAAKDQLE